MEDASLRGMPFLAWEDCPRHLYHRTTKDAAISILNQAFKPGDRDSGKMHVYFADKPLEEMESGPITQWRWWSQPKRCLKQG